jgi:hypothetical protein
MNALENISLKDMFIGFAEALNEQTSKLPAGCLSRMENGTYTAKAIANVATFNDNVLAPDGFINNGLYVRLVDNVRAKPTDKYNGYRAVFELAGKFNGICAVFCKTESQYKMYVNPDMWRIDTVTIKYIPVDEKNADTKEFERDYLVPMTIDLRDNEFRCVDKRNSIENKVAMAMKRFSEDYDAVLDGNKFSTEDSKFNVAL